MKDPMKLREVLMFHVVEGKMMIGDLKDHEYLQALNGGELRIDVKSWHLHKNIKVNETNIIKPNLIVDNGVCHALDKVLMPKMASMNKPM